MSQQNIWSKLGVIFILTVVLSIGIYLIRDLVTDRASVDAQVQSEVTSKWGGRQTIGRIFLRVPYAGGANESRAMYFAPSELEVTGEVWLEERYRGLHKVPLYRGEFQLKGSFKNLELPASFLEKPALDWSRTEVVVPFDDMRADKSVEVRWNGLLSPSRVFSSTTPIVTNGFSAALTSSSFNGGSFTANMRFTGSRSLALLPYAARSSFKIKGDWKHVSYKGYSFPAQRTVGVNGFDATWIFPTAFQALPQVFSSSEPPGGWEQFASRAEVFADTYDATERASKYGLLFIVLTFATLFILESIYVVRLHPAQYFMIGTAVALFFLLLLSLSEHIGFNLAYVSAALATISLITGYAKAILHARRRAAGLTVFLSILYVYLFVVVRAEEVALLMGSLGLFGFLALAMYFTRRINWFDAEISAKKTVEV